MYKIIGGDGKEYGPIPAGTLRQWIEEGRANAESKVRADGAGNWQALGTVAEFADLFGVSTGPRADAVVTDAPGNAEARGLANPAGWALMIVGVLGILMCLGFIMSYAVKGVPPSPLEGMFGGHNSSAAFRAGEKAGRFSALLVGVAEAGFFIFAGWKLRRLESWGLVLTAAILAIIPFCGSRAPLCLLSAPVGIWVIVVICLPKVKSAFP